MNYQAVTCVSCTTEADLPEGASAGRAGDVMKHAGYRPVCSVRDGIELLWVCPGCAHIIGELANRIGSMFPERDRPYLHWSNLLALGAAGRTALGENGGG